jgi:hypothetical protein
MTLAVQRVMAEQSLYKGNYSAQANVSALKGFAAFIPDAKYAAMQPPTPMPATALAAIPTSLYPAARPHPADRAG